MNSERNIIRLRGAAATAVALALAGLLAAPFLVRECDVCEAATSIFLSGYVAGKCTIGVTPDIEAVNLAVDTTAPQRVPIGSVLQDCNGKRSYAIAVTSWNCAAPPTGGKLMADGTDDYLPYTVEFNNPTTGGSQGVVTNLLATACTGQIARTVTSHNVSDETSTVYLNFTGSTELEAGTYEDVVTISITMM
ncbi:hypothetical protein [Thalassobaculum sp.]|uniref:hypothetical protein n=1 Tax=Thalassobaculum sp. TaxID=2022740 RepID=UPI0032EB5409